jgi:sRNA-binding regulator protein Hfq
MNSFPSAPDQPAEAIYRKTGFLQDIFICNFLTLKRLYTLYLINGGKISGIYVETLDRWEKA